MNRQISTAQQSKAEATRRQHLEEDEQRSLFEWVNWMSGRIPELELLLHIPNGGKRNKLEAIRLKREGVRAGVPDLFLPVARGKYHGMFVELKAGKGKPTNLQKEWIRRLNEQGYHALVINGWEAAAKAIMEYLRMEV